MTKIYQKDLEVFFFPETSQQNIPLQEKNFVDCCLSRKETISPAETGARTAILCQLCNLSYVYDSSFDWDPVKCTFANHTGDPAWLKRPYNRNGWDIKL